MKGGRNGEGYRDPTASIAIGRIAKEEKRKKHGSKNYHGRAGVDRKDRHRLDLDRLSPAFGDDVDVCPKEGQARVMADDRGRSNGTTGSNKQGKA